MKAIILYDYKIWDGVTNMQNSHIGETVDIIGQTDAATTLNTGGIAFCCVLSNGGVVNIQDSWLQILPDEQIKPINWEQRRWEAAIKIYCARFTFQPNDHANFEAAVYDAGKLIEEYKKQNE